MSEAVRVVPHDALEPGPSTAGMVRSTAASTDTLWMGEVRTTPGARSGWHHHGEHTTFGHVVSGQIEFEFGSNGTARVVARAGDFFVVPPHTVHREGNPGSEEHVLVGVRIGTGPTVINVDGPDPA
jgi:uncharacterized RmlC-like cupin family protein